jgi:glycosyltransferase involved in cell wall biosynthesis
VKIVLVISSMGPGGAERVVSHLSACWAERGREVVILTLSGEPSFYELSDQVELLGLDLLSPSANKWAGAVNNLERVRALRRTIRTLRPDVVISFMDKTNILALLATRGLGLPVIVSERIFPGIYKPGVEWEAMRKATYRFASRVVAVADDLRRALEQRGIGNVEVIPNPVVAAPAEGSRRTSGEVDKGPRVLMAAGRLVHQKGFDLLIESFAALHHTHPDWELVIVGEGELREQLVQLADRHGVSGKVRLPGIVRDLKGVLSGAEIFVLSSRSEGFPNVLLEAMAAGRAVVAADCPTGPGEIIRNDENGLLIPAEDAAALIHALELLMSDATLRKRLGSNARNVSEAYSLDSVMRKWDRVIDEAIAA